MKKQTKIALLLCCAGVAVLFVAMTVFSLNDFSEKSKKMNDHVTSDEFKSDFQDMAITNQPIKDARILAEQGHWNVAISKLVEALRLKKEKGYNEWVPRYRLAEAYEAVNDIKNALVHIEWLIAHSSGQDKLNELNARKVKLLNNQ
jgi:hypothetical protein